MITLHLQKRIFLNVLIGICFSFMSHLCLAGDAVPPSIKQPSYLDTMNANSVAERFLGPYKGSELKNDYPKTPKKNSSKINVQEVASRTKKATNTAAKVLIDANTQKEVMKAYKRTKHTQPKNRKAKELFKKRVSNKANNVSKFGKSLKPFAKGAGLLGDGLVIYNAFDLYQDGDAASAGEELIRMAVKKFGCYAGGAIAGTVTSPTGPGVAVAALGGCIAGEYVADKTCDGVIYFASELESLELNAGTWSSPPGYDCVSGVTPGGRRWNDPSVKWGADANGDTNYKDYGWSREWDDFEKAKERNRNKYANTSGNLMDEQRKFDEYQELLRQQEVSSSSNNGWLTRVLLGVATGVMVGNVLNNVSNGMGNISGTSDQCLKLKQQISAYQKGISQLDMRDNFHRQQKQAWDAGIKHNQDLFNNRCQ